MAKPRLRFLPHTFLLWIIFTILITGFCGLVYGTVQQNYRQGANDPQIQMAEDGATSLDTGQKVNATGFVDVGKSLAPFLIIYNSQGQVVSSSAVLNGKTPELPPGIFDNVKNNGEERFTWQPKDDVRIAAVVTKYKDGYVLAGRSLLEVEKRERKLELQVAAVWLVSITLVTMLSILL